ncbi:MAG: hypothetical protein JWM10_997 [Myxococcaceae bacterium]|nr:hypothetical protein [Myxococcaceae bacterium]
MGAKGKPLGPAELDTLATMYAQCGNAAAVARAMGLKTSTVTRQLANLGEQRRATLQRDALLSGLVDGRERVDRAVRGVSAKLWAALKKTPPQPKGSSLFETEPQTIQQLGSTLARLVSVQILLDRREEQRRQSELTREKTRAEISAIEKRVDELPPMSTLKSKLSPAQVLELMRSLSTDQLEALRALARPKEAAPAQGP